jgi:hypothetical protein
MPQGAPAGDDQLTKSVILARLVYGPSMDFPDAVAQKAVGIGFKVRFASLECSVGMT